MANSLRTFWRRVSDGIEMQQLWAQFHAEARASYELYSKEVRWTQLQGESRRRRLRRVIRGLFWAMMMKLSPGRRVLLLIALVFLAFSGLNFRFGETEIQLQNLAFLGWFAFLVLLALELADRVMMKRDLEIAREIQSWLMPATPPAVPGVDIAFASHPANTVAGDYYDAFLRPAAGDSGPQSPAPESPERLLLVVADVVGKSVPAALLMATLQASLRTLAGLPTSLLELVPLHHGFPGGVGACHRMSHLCERRTQLAGASAHLGRHRASGNRRLAAWHQAASTIRMRKYAYGG
jgi:phosphoserine phosphatase RsbU/P